MPDSNAAAPPAQKYNHAELKQALLDACRFISHTTQGKRPDVQPDMTKLISLGWHSGMTFDADQVGYASGDGGKR